MTMVDKGAVKKGTRRKKDQHQEFVIDCAEIINAIDILEKENGIEMSEITERIARGIESAVNEREQDKYGLNSKVKISVRIDREKKEFYVYQKRKIIPDDVYNVQFLITQKGYTELKAAIANAVKDLAAKESVNNELDDQINATEATNGIIKVLRDANYNDSMTEEELDELEENLYSLIAKYVESSMLTACSDIRAMKDRINNNYIDIKGESELSRNAINRVVSQIEYSDVEYISLEEALSVARDVACINLNMYEKVERPEASEVNIGNGVVVIPKRSKFLPITSLIQDAVGGSSSNAMGNYVLYPYSINGLSRTQTKTVKESLIQMLREKNNQRRENAFNSLKNKTIYARISGFDNEGNIYVEFNPVEGLVGTQQAKLSVSDKIDNERYDIGKTIAVVIRYQDDRGDGRKRSRELCVTRKSPELVRGLFEREIPEIGRGIVNIVGIAREAGVRTKVAVSSNDSDINAVGTCIGHNHERINAIMKSLNTNERERIDIIEYSSDPAKFVANALSPAKVLLVKEIANTDIRDDENEGRSYSRRVPATKMQVVVNSDNYKTAMGTKAINVRLAAKLTGNTIEIKRESEVSLTM